MTERTEAREPMGGWSAAMLLSASFFIVIAPTLSWMEFSNGIENLVVGTALEINRTGRWLLPELEGEPRVAKPPLAAWIAAAAIRSSTLVELDAPDPAIRAAAYRRLAWEIRWPSLACSCLMLLAIFDLGKTVAGVRCGLFSAGVAGSTIFFFAYSRQATTDVQLALWASVSNAFLARMCLRRASWRASLGAGAALGLALMSKGPVVFLQSAAPVAIFALLRRPEGLKGRLAPILAGAGLMLIVGGAWFALVLARVPGVWARWAIEVSRSGGVSTFQSSPLAYISLLREMLPWTPLLVHGLIWTAVETCQIARRRLGWESREGWVLAFLLTATPLLTMSFFPDRKERYLLPLVGACALLATRALEVTLTPATGSPRVWPWVQWALVAGLGLGIPIAAASGPLRRATGETWYTIEFAAGAAALIALVIIAGVLLSRRRPEALLGTTILVMMLLQPIVYRGFSESRRGESDMRPLAELIRDRYPDAQMHNWRPGSKRVSVDLSIYLNRVTRWTPEPETLPPSARPQVCVRVQNSGEPEPAPPAANWVFLAKVPRDNDHYVAFVRQATAATKPSDP